MYGPGEEDDCLGSLIPIFCPKPFADADEDGDVDQDDFAQFQLCYTGTGGGVPEGCVCFDRANDSDIDDDDFSEFQKCASGPNVSVVGDPDCDFTN
jgi:hypothetical protein